MNLDLVLADLSRDPDADHDLAAVALELAREEYPALDIAGYLDQIRDLARDARGHIGGGVREQAVGLCRYLFHEVGFHGNAKEYYDPRNSYLSDVLDRLTGIPITLSLVTIAVGQRIGLPLEGLGLPGHFVVQCRATEPHLFIDPFHGGRLLTPDQCEALVARVTGDAAPLGPVDFQPVSPALFLQRMLNNLRGIYLRADDSRRAARILSRLHQLCPGDVHVRRDLGLCLVRNRQPGLAIDHLATYLAAVPDSDDVEKVRFLLQAARREVGRWN